MNTHRFSSECYCSHARSLSLSLGTSKLVIFRRIDYESIIILSRQDNDEDDVGAVKGNIRFEHTVRATFKEQNIYVCIDGKVEGARERERALEEIVDHCECTSKTKKKKRMEKNEQLKSVHMMGILVLPMHVQSVRLPVGDDVGEWNR